jgi:hypothetical protein
VVSNVGGGFTSILGFGGGSSSKGAPVKATIPIHM